MLPVESFRPWAASDTPHSNTINVANERLFHWNGLFTKDSVFVSQETYRANRRGRPAGIRQRTGWVHRIR